MALANYGYQIPFHHCRKYQAMEQVLPATPDSENLGIDSGTFGSVAPKIHTGDVKAATTTKYLRFQFSVPDRFPQTLFTLRINAGMVTTVADGSAMLDAEITKTTNPNTDICGTGEQSINSLTATDINFSINTGSLSVGDLLDIRLKISVIDTATASEVKAAINSIKPLLE